MTTKNLPPISKLTVQLSASIRNAMHIISDGGLGLCFVLRDQCLVGVVTDGDVRRALLNGSLLDDNIETAMTKDFCSLRINAPLALIQEKLNHFKFIPIINENGELVDLASKECYHQIPLVQPELNGNELEYITDCITTNWVSSQGKYVRKFEEIFGDYVGCKNTLAVSNGTVALHLALVALGVGKGDEVIVPDLTFAATVNSVLYSGATPVLVDVDPLTMVINTELISDAITDKTKAIIPVHLYGYPAELDRIMAIANKHNLLVIEDCAEALGSIYKGSHVGIYGHAATFSFYGNKTITTGEGGMLLFRDSSIFNHAKILRDHGMSPQRRYWHDQVGFNYRLTNMQAAIGVAQLERIDFFIDKKRWLASQYHQRLIDIPQLQLPVEPDQSQSLNSYWLYTVILIPECVNKRDKVLEILNSRGIEARPVFIPMHRMPPYIQYALSSGGYDSSNYLSDCGLSLPSSIAITENEINHVCSTLRSALLME